MRGENKSAYSAALRAARLKLGMSQAQVADLLGDYLASKVDVRKYQQWEDPKASFPRNRAEVSEGLEKLLDIPDRQLQRHAGLIIEMPPSEAERLRTLEARISRWEDQLEEMQQLVRQLLQTQRDDRTGRAGRRRS